MRLNVQLGDEHSHPEPYRDPTRQEIVTYLRRLVALPNAHRPRVSDKLKAIEIVANLCGLNKPVAQPIQVDVHLELQAVIAKMRGGSHQPELKQASAIDVSAQPQAKQIELQE